MNEEEVREYLQDKGLSEEEINHHITRIRMESKGYWSEYEANIYIKNTIDRK